VGKIIDKNQKPVPYAHILMENTNKGTISDDSGCFRLKIPEDIESIKITSVGFQPKSIHKSSLSAEVINQIKLY
jgi:hypothetical protein